jgi:hypothetical protein
MMGPGFGGRIDQRIFSHLSMEGLKALKRSAEIGLQYIGSRKGKRDAERLLNRIDKRLRYMRAEK